MRATSTVVDAALFLLLVSAAVGVVSFADGNGQIAPADGADGTADVLTTSTATVQYTLAPGARRADSEVVKFTATSGPRFQRTAHGTLAGHFVTAALGNLTVSGQRATHTRVDYERAVANATRNLTRTRDTLAQVRAVWEPYPGAPIRGVARAGPVPPQSTDVHAEAVTVASGMPTARGSARRAARNGSFAAVGDAVAGCIVRGLFPPERTRTALLGDYPVEQLVTYRYERFGRLLGANVTAQARADNATAANAALSRALGERLAADMRRRFGSPSAAADAVAVDSVRITVRTWSP